MPLEVPHETKKAMLALEADWKRLKTAGQSNRAKWTKDQMNELYLMSEMLKNLNNALYNLMKANS